MKVKLPALEGFKGNVAVPEVDELDFVEIVGANVYGQVLAPIILNPLKADRRSRLHVCDFVGARTKRNFKRWRADVALLATWRPCPSTNASAAQATAR